MKSRRFMDFALGPKPKNVTTSWKPVVQRNSKVPTSALGQKQTSAHVGGMSALSPKADIAEG